MSSCQNIFVTSPHCDSLTKKICTTPTPANPFGNIDPSAADFEANYKLLLACILKGPPCSTGCIAAQDLCYTGLVPSCIAWNACQPCDTL